MPLVDIRYIAFCFCCDYNYLMSKERHRGVLGLIPGEGTVRRAFRNSVQVLAGFLKRNPLEPKEMVGVRVPRKPHPPTLQEGAKIDPRKE